MAFLLPFRCPHCDCESELCIYPECEFASRCPVCKMAVLVPNYHELAQATREGNDGVQPPHILASVAGKHLSQCGEL
jgi:hypothetical protein